jgi:hypothetical protein
MEEQHELQVKEEGGFVCKMSCLQEQMAVLFLGNRPRSKEIRKMWLTQGS